MTSKHRNRHSGTTAISTLRTAAFGAAFAAGLVGSVCAAEITLTDGRKLNGVVQDVPGDPSRVAIVTDDGTRVLLPKARVKSVTGDNTEKPWKLVVEKLVADKDFAGAQKYLEDQIRLKPKDKEMPAELERVRKLRVEAGDKSAMTGSEALAAAVDKAATAAAAPDLWRSAPKDLEAIDKELKKLAGEVASVPALAAKVDQAQGKVALARAKSEQDRMNWEASIKAADEALAKDPKNEEALRVRATGIARDPARQADAISAWESLRGANPKDVDAAIALEALYAKARRFDEAAALVKEIEAAGKLKPEAARARATALYKAAVESQAKADAASGSFEKTIALAKKLVADYPGAESEALLGYYTYADIYVKAKDAPALLAAAEAARKAGFPREAAATEDEVLTGFADSPEALKIAEARGPQLLAQLQQQFAAGQFANAIGTAQELLTDPRFAKWRETPQGKAAVAQASSTTEQSSIKIKELGQQLKELAQRNLSNARRNLETARAMSLRLMDLNTWQGNTGPISIKRDGLDACRDGLAYLRDAELYSKQAVLALGSPPPVLQSEIDETRRELLKLQAGLSGFTRHSDDYYYKQNNRNSNNSSSSSSTNNGVTITVNR